MSARCSTVILLVIFLLCSPVTLGQECVGQQIFVVVSSKEANAAVLQRRSVQTLTECITACRRERTTCRAVHFVTSDLLQPSCEILGALPAGHINALKDSTRVGYHAYPVCLPTVADLPCRRSWTFELAPSWDIADSRHLIQTPSLKNTREECMVDCLRVDNCRAVLYHPGTRACALAGINRHAVRSVKEYFRAESSIEFYENNCVPEPADQCHFMYKRGEGVTHVYDKLYTGILTSKDCKRLCELDSPSPDFTCRSFTHDDAESTCYLSHVSNTAIPDSWMRRRDSLDSGFIDDCVQFDLHCHPDDMRVQARTRRLFHGRVSARSTDSVVPLSRCGKTVTDQFVFEAAIAYDGCGTEKEQNSGAYSNLVFVKYGSGRLITFRDRLLRLICNIVDGTQLDATDVAVSYKLTVQNSTVSKTLTVTGSPTIEAQPEFRLNILNENGQPAGKVSIGDTGYIEIEMIRPGRRSFADDKSNNDEPSSLGLRVSNIVAYDPRTDTRVELFDDDGCPIDRDLAGQLKHVSNSKLRAKVRFFGFRDTSLVHYKGLVKPCYGDDCSIEANCPLSPSFRNRRHRRQSIPVIPQLFRRHPDVSVLSDLQYLIRTNLALRNWTWNSSPLTVVNDGSVRLRDAGPVDVKLVTHRPLVRPITAAPPTTPAPSLSVATPTPGSPVKECLSDLVCGLSVFFAILQIFMLICCAAMGYYLCRSYDLPKRRQELFTAIRHCRFYNQK